MQRRHLGTLFSLAIAVFVGALTIYISYTKLKEPQIFLDWAALVFSGLTTAVIAFFISWGHFQTDPVPPPQDPST